MAEAAMTRRVYVLSGDLAGKVRAFAAERGQSEVAAVRQLLRESLDHRETGTALETRAAQMLGRHAGLVDVTGILAGHPQVAALTKTAIGADVECFDGHHFTIAEAQRG